MAPSTLSLWASVEAILAATYHGLHSEAVRRSLEWHIEADHVPGYVLWWVEVGHQPKLLRSKRHLTQWETPISLTQAS